MPEQDPTMQLLEQPPVAYFNEPQAIEPQLATQQPERFNAARRIGAVVGATLALSGAAMAQRSEGPLGTEPAHAREVATKVTLPQTGINLLGGGTKPAATKKRPLLSSFDLSKFPEGYFDNGVPYQLYKDCGSTMIGSEKSEISFANPQRTKTRITVELSGYQEDPYCEALGDLSAKTWAEASNGKNRLIRKTPIKKVNIISKRTEYKVVLPIYQPTPKCTLREVVQVKWTSEPIKNRNNVRETWQITYREPGKDCYG